MESLLGLWMGEYLPNLVIRVAHALMLLLSSGQLILVGWRISIMWKFWIEQKDHVSNYASFQTYRLHCFYRQEDFFAICWPNVVFMPKMWNLQPKIIFTSRIECCPVPSWNMTRSILKRGSESWGWVNVVKKIKIVVWCLFWQQIKAVDSLNHLKLFKNC